MGCDSKRREEEKGERMEEEDRNARRIRQIEVEFKKEDIFISLSKFLFVKKHRTTLYRVSRNLF